MGVKMGTGEQQRRPAQVTSSSPCDAELYLAHMPWPGATTAVGGCPSLLGRGALGRGAPGQRASAEWPAGGVSKGNNLGCIGADAGRRKRADNRSSLNQRAGMWTCGPEARG
jgi:hypothetical protein